MTTTSIGDHSAPLNPVLTGGNGGVRVLTLNRPTALNAFDSAMKERLLAEVTVAADDDAVRAVLLTGAGGAFSAGQDLKEHLARVAASDPSVDRTVTEFYNPLIRTITGMRKPVIAAVSGVAAGAGAALAFACDLRIAARSASFSMAFAQVALSADSGASYTLPRLIGRGRASMLMLSGRKVDADEALRIGMVDEVVDDDGLPEAALAWATRLAEGPTEALGWIKSSLAYGETHSLGECLEFENRAQQTCFASADHREALDAFVGKRRPIFHT